jgi:hypothetical protein
MAHSDGLGSRADNPLVRAVGRVPVTVRTKLLVAFGGIAALLVVVGVLGLRVLGQSNARVTSLGTLQLRAATYQSLQTQAEQLRQLLALRVADDPSVTIYTGGRASALGGRRWTLVDRTIAATVSQLGPATNETRFGFVPPPEDEALLGRIRQDYRGFLHTVQQVIASDRAGATSSKSKPLLTDAIAADNDLTTLTDQLAVTTRAQTDALIAQNRGSYADSRNLAARASSWRCCSGSSSPGR